MTLSPDHKDRPWNMGLGVIILHGTFGGSKVLRRWGELWWEGLPESQLGWVPQG